MSENKMCGFLYFCPLVWFLNSLFIRTIKRLADGFISSSILTFEKAFLYRTSVLLRQPLPWCCEQVNTWSMALFWHTLPSVPPVFAQTNRFVCETAPRRAGVLTSSTAFASSVVLWVPKFLQRLEESDTERKRGLPENNHIYESKNGF